MENSSADFADFLMNVAEIAWWELEYISEFRNIEKRKKIAKVLMMTIANRSVLLFYVENTKYTFTTLLLVKLKK